MQGIGCEMRVTTVRCTPFLAVDTEGFANCRAAANLLRVASEWLRVRWREVASVGCRDPKVLET